MVLQLVEVVKAFAATLTWDSCVCVCVCVCVRIFGYKREREVGQTESP